MFTALRSRDFRLLWIGQSASVIGDNLVVVALALFVTRLTGRASDVAAVLVAYSLPMVAFVLVGGVLADRLPRQRVIVSTDLIRAVLHGVLALLIATGTVRVWQMVVIGVCFATAEAFFRPAYTGLIPQTVAESDIQSAQALSGMSSSLAEFASPALATALVLGVGGATAFGLDALTFCVSAFLIWRVRPRSRGDVAVEPAPVLRELREGWLALRERTWVWATILSFSVTLLLALAPFFVLGATVSRTQYGGEGVFGLTNACWGIGTVTGAVIASRWRPLHPMRTGQIASLWWPLAIAVYAAGAPLPITYLSMTLAGVGIGMFGVWWETALAQRIPPHLLSRVSAWDWMGSLALLPLGYLLAGLLADVFGAVPVMLVGGLAGGVSMLLGLAPASTRHLRRLEEPALPVADTPLAELTSS
ncbi:predicted MFS family arabinose efflux permease [Jatrophihabitans sp. GAS493]|uniref:MFS transporter n=1 Tax=Jatrophihabitans sp. GAS493 TaxID=1907575 RepID=UPI000BB95D98|nr:MFS transporter [Jatrophihabitans sp. GAS493]SOD74279.1 predicted MFS family arabinose efflux permease [Jatrophihabitans sp. GAS493]